MEQLNFNTNSSNNQGIKTKKLYSHLSYKDRKNIEALIKLKNDPNYNGPSITLQYIANQIGCSKSTISRELKKTFIHVVNGVTVTNYDAYHASCIAADNSKRSHYHSKFNDTKNCLKVLHNICKNENISLEYAIQVYNESNDKFPVSSRTLYRYASKGLFKLKYFNMKPYKKVFKHSYTAKRDQVGKNISERPIEADKRLEFGHFEADLIVGTRNGHKECLFTLTDRLTRLEICYKIPNKTTVSVIEILNFLETKLTTDNFKKIFKTITFDNGTEFSDVKGMTTSIDGSTTRTDVYFANPYCSYQRGSNERANRSIRRFFPKGTDFSTISDSKIHTVMNKLNFQKRKVLNNESAVSYIKNFVNIIPDFFNLLDIVDPFKDHYNSYKLN